MILLSPAKNMKFDQTTNLFESSSPYFSKETNYLINKLRELTKTQIKKMMKLSDNLSNLNYDRYKSFTISSKDNNNAILVFNGDTFKGLNAKSFSKEDIFYSQKRLRIISGLYGLIKPLDNIQPYRLEMGSPTSNFIGTSLYEFWSDIITKQINSEMIDNEYEILFNLASVEYFKCVDRERIDGEIITPIFYQKREGKLKNIGIISKKSRGQMANFIIKNKINNINDLKDFNIDGYKFDSFDKKLGNIFFIKN